MSWSDFLHALIKLLGARPKPTPAPPPPGPPPAPPPPPVRAVGIFAIAADGRPVTTYEVWLTPFGFGAYYADVHNPDGYQVFNEVQSISSGFSLKIVAPGFKPYTESVAYIPPHNIDLVCGGAANPNQIQLPALDRVRLPLPPVPTRAQVCGIKTHFQGLYYQTAEFGRIPAEFLTLLTDADRDRAFATHKAAGDTHCTMELTGAYREPHIVYPPRLAAGKDWSNDLPGIKAKVREAVVAGLFVDFALGGDGRSVNSNPSFGQYNDPVGDTYGWDWLMINIGRIVKAFRGDADSAAPDGEDLTPYMIFRPGYDAVFYGWGGDQDGVDRQPDRVVAFGERFRRLLLTGYLSIEHDTGHIPVGSGPGDYAGRMQVYDAILSEFPNWPETGDAVWQVAGRLLGPQYVRPVDQPADDDTHPPFYLAAGTPRGPYFAVAFEYAKYYEAHGIDVDVNAARAYYRALGYQYFG